MYTNLMKKSVLLTALACLMIQPAVFSQEKDPAFGIKFTGYVKSDFILDTRQTVSLREGHFLLYPADELLDEEGKDINARANFNFLSIQSRLTGKITGPEAFGAKTSGILEGEFFGASNSGINQFRLRHALIKLNWTSTELLLGQYWHMNFVTDCFPGTVSFNTGAPFLHFSRNPQIRITQWIGKLSISGMAATERDFTSPAGSEGLRNSLLPDLNGQIAYKTDHLLVGAAVGYKKIVPRLETDSLYKTSASIGGISGNVFLKVSSKPVTFKCQATYLENGYDGLSIGGFAVRSITDPVRDYRDYTTLNTLSFWTELHTNGEKLQVGLFAGYSKNLGSREALDDVSTIGTYSRGSNIVSLYRVSPRVIVNSGKVRFAFEMEHTGAFYGDTIDEYGMPGDLDLQVNYRFLAAVYYFF
jgi:hypothetical protein